MINRQINKIGDIKGLDEIKYLSFTSLHKLVGKNKYRLYNFNTNQRAKLELVYQDIFSRLLETNIIKEIYLK
jgi:hypothetical protein